MGDLEVEFGDLDARLARMHEVSDRHRTKFQARLKNLHRIGWPLGFQSTKGKASRYGPGAILDMAVALELVQLGLTPERISALLTVNRWPTLVAYKLAAESLSRSKDPYFREPGEAGPDPIVIYFEPSALSGLVDEASAHELESYFFFFSTAGDFVKGISRTLRESRRVSVLNVTDLLDAVAVRPFDSECQESPDFRRRFFDAVADWATGELRSWPNRDRDEARYVARYILHNDFLNADELAARTAIRPDRAIKYHEKIYGNDT